MNTVEVGLPLLYAVIQRRRLLSKLSLSHNNVAFEMVLKREARVQSLGWEDPLEKEMATHSSILAWEIPWTEEPGRLQSMGSQKSWDMI